MLSRLNCLNYQNWSQFKTLLNHRSVVQLNCMKVLSTNRIEFQQKKTDPSFERSLVKHNTILSTCMQKFNDNPYVRLSRLDRPIGGWLLFWPCGWSIALAADPGHIPDLKSLAIFCIGSFVMRGAGCTVNDMIDKKIDEKVTRTMSRPLVTGEISIFDAWFFLGAQLAIGLDILIRLNNYCLLLGCSSIFLLSMYPLMKRITYWPQFVLGLAFNWGVFMGYAAVQNDVYWQGCLPLYMAGVSWTIIYDTIYAHQDRLDDLKVGMKSTAIRFGKNSKTWLTGFGGLMASSLIATGVACDLAWPFYLSTAVVMTHVGQQIHTLKIDDPQDCAKKFISNHNVGLLLFCGIILGVLMQKSKDDDEPGKKTDQKSALMNLINQTLPVKL